MITLQQAMEQAAKKPIKQWNIEEILAAEICRSDGEVRRLRKQLEHAEAHSSRLKQQWYSLSKANAAVAKTERND